jgi:broad specificity phosphatase PhoE
VSFWVFSGNMTNRMMHSDSETGKGELGETGRDFPLKHYLIRHGETEWSLTGQHAGITDIPLTARGEGEARELARRLRSIPFAHVLTSPLPRAKRTCDLAALGPVSEDESDLMEWDYGDYEGRRSVDILQTQLGWNIFIDGGPNGETAEQVLDRADRLIARLRRLSGNVALFTHGHFGRVLAVRWIGLPVIVGQHLQLGTGSCSILSYDPHHVEVPVIAQWNATASAEDEPVNTNPIERWENEGGEIPDRQLQSAAC